jgi:hypothetical protein
MFATMQLQSFSTNLADARSRADEIVRQLSKSPEFANQLYGDRADVNPPHALLACVVTCRWTCSWTSFEE